MILDVLHASLQNQVQRYDKNRQKEKPFCQINPWTVNCMNFKPNGCLKLAFRISQRQLIITTYQLADTTVPISWYYSTNWLILQYQLAGTAVPFIMYQSWYWNALSFPWQYFVIGKAVFCKIFLLYLLPFFRMPWKGKIGDWALKNEKPPNTGFPVGKKNCLTGNIFFSNWALFYAQLEVSSLLR